MLHVMIQNKRKKSDLDQQGSSEGAEIVLPSSSTKKPRWLYPNFAGGTRASQSTKYFFSTESSPKKYRNYVAPMPSIIDAKLKILRRLIQSRYGKMP